MLKKYDKTLQTVTRTMLALSAAKLQIGDFQHPLRLLETRL